MKVGAISGLESEYLQSTLGCLLSRENLNPTFSLSYNKMTIIFDVPDRFQENKVFHTVQTMNNSLRSNAK